MFNSNYIYFFCLLVVALSNASSVPRPLSLFGDNNTRLSSFEDSENEESNEEGGKIIGGETTTIDKYPHQVSLLYLGSQICGGSIISEYYVVTAAHCTYGSKAIQLAITYASSYRGVGILNPVGEIYQHPQYNPNTLDLDVSVLKFLAAIVFSQYAQPIPLCTDPVADGTLTTITGFGNTKPDQSSPATQLQVAVVPTASQENCQRAFPSLVITENMICIGYPNGGVNACFGDSGGPMTVNKKLCGITSFGHAPCAQANDYAVYVNVRAVTGFILGVTGPIN